MALATSTDVRELVASLGVRPMPDDLLGEALTHASYLNEADASALSNERLELILARFAGVLVDRYPCVALDGQYVARGTRPRARAWKIPR